MASEFASPPLFQLAALQTWTARTDTGPSLEHFPMSLPLPCSRTGSTGRTGTHTQWRGPTSTLAKSAQSWAITRIGRMTFTSTTRIGSLVVCTVHLNFRHSYAYFIVELFPSIDQYIIFNFIYFSGENPCSSHDLTCSHLCLIAPGGQGAFCECPDHFISLSVGFDIQCVADCSSTQFRCGDNERFSQI